jgi:uncharacterized membrane protein
VLVMIQTHSLVLLRPELRAGSFYAGLQWIDGLVAPSFIFAAGFALALTQVRAALASNAPEARRKRFLRTLRRLGEVLFVATLVNWAWFPIFREPRWLIRIDILHCVGLSLLIALPILALLAPHPRALRWSSLLLAALAFGLAPLFEQVPPPWGNFVSFRTGSVFPLLPWGGYVFLGAAVGAACAADGIRATVKWLLALAAVGIALWIATPQVSALYPPHEFWVTDPTNHARRWTQVCLIALALLAAEQLWQGNWRASLPVRFVEVFGTSSLAGYFFHEMLLYYRIAGFSFERVWGNACNWPRYGMVLALLIACTFGLTWVTDKVYQRVDRGLRSA